MVLVAAVFGDFIDVILERSVIKFVDGIMPAIVVVGRVAVVNTGSVELELFILVVSTKHTLQVSFYLAEFVL